MSSNFNCSYMARSSLTYIPGFKSSPLKPLNQIKSNLAGMVPGWVLFKIVSDSPALHARWLLLLKIEISSIVHCFFSTSQNGLKFQKLSISLGNRPGNRSVNSLIDNLEFPSQRFLLRNLKRFND